MEEKIDFLYEKLRNITAAYLIYQKRNNLETIKEIIPQMQEFVLWFMDGNRFDIEQELYQEMCQNLLYILQDILEALKEEDKVLLHDAVAYGFMDYLELFANVEKEENVHDNL